MTSEVNVEEAGGGSAAHSEARRETRERRQVD